jgi:HSP90 family molecular chaperone
MKIYKKKNFNVLILTDPVDEPCFDRLIVYDGRPIVSIEKTGDQIGNIFF